MKMKRLIKASMLLMVVTLFAACANEDIAQDKKKENGTEAPKGGVIFAANGPKTSAKRLSIDGEDEFAGVKTRTNIKHTVGQGADAYWTSDDFIYVKDKNGNIQRSTHTELHDGGASAEFTLPGSKADYTDGCEVRYTGTGAYNYALLPEYHRVGFASQFKSTIANNFNDAGGGGDCGSGKAYATGNPAKFNFRLSHKVAYLCFLPRCENAALAPNIRLTHIKLTATKCYSDPSTPLTDFFDFDGETIGPGGLRLSPFNTIHMTDFSFPLFTTANQEANAVYCVIRPDTYDFKIEYIIKDPTTNVETVVTQTLTNKTFDKGLIYDITADLAVSERPNLPKYYMWNAHNDYWHGYESEQPFINQGQSGATQGQHYPKNGFDPRWGDDGYSGPGVVYEAYSAPAFQGLPNINELWWYVTKGKPYWDANGGSYVWSSGGHLRRAILGGIWLKKKNAIVAYLKAYEAYPATLTWEKMKEAYGGPGTAANPIASPQDFRPRYSPQVTSVPTTQGRPSEMEMSDYFFIPALGYYHEGWLNGLGSHGYYWSYSAFTGYGPYAYYLYFNSSSVEVKYNDRFIGYQPLVFE